MLNMSPAVPEAPPPSPAWSVMPGTFRIASERVNDPCSDITPCGITWMVCGVADSAVAYFGDSTRGSRPVTSSDSRTPMTSTA